VAVGCDADLIVLDDDFNVKLTLVGGMHERT
jgi:N-acetylglucosamine-6-phosphate deacetylase